MGCGCGRWERRTLEDGKKGGSVMDELVARIEGEGGDRGGREDEEVIG
jgi:hypothetical protein